MGDCVEIYEKIGGDDKRFYMHVHDGPIQVWVNDHLVYETPKEELLEDKQAREAYAKLEG